MYLFMGSCATCGKHLLQEVWEEILRMGNSRIKHLANGVNTDAPHVVAEAAELCQHLDRRRRIATLLQVVPDERLGGAVDVYIGTARLEKFALTEADGSSTWVL